MDKAKLLDISKFLISILLCQFAGIIGSIFTMPAIPTWYSSLKKPSFAPPNSWFGPVWITLFALMAIAAFIVWHKGLSEPGVKTALIIFVIQLILNVLWSVAFFGLRSPIGGLMVIVSLWIAILATVIIFSGMSKIAGLLLVPYIVWVSFATVLNFLLWRLNI